ncbi:MAG: type II toxin-antitoxin system HicA family toxin [Chloroflexi bacterium]|nr:type II toxin-antitoxin system HicA family toxin [Chloroflexota bacterium]
MSPRLRGLKARAVIKAFERAGGARRGGKGDHVNIKMPNGMIGTFKAVGEVKIGLLNKMIKRAGLSEKEFLEHLE